jgi:hypothetical protein
MKMTGLFNQWLYFSAIIVSNMVTAFAGPQPLL